MFAYNTRMPILGGLAALFACLCLASAAGDADRDGVSDALEQELLLRFLPKFMVSAGECDGLPAEFRPGTRDPQVLAKNGTIYARVFPVKPAGRPGAFLELHYYHLWGRDCGRAGHPLDVEHVSALVSADAPEPSAPAWKALYWYAAAHEETLCAASNGARAPLVGGGESGPEVWISAGKHASFLSLQLCRGGCGGDRCTEMRPFAPPKVINLGEPGAPMNGCDWISSRSWPLRDKMAADFSESVLAQLDDPYARGIEPVNDAVGTAKAIILGGGATAGGLATAQRKTEGALDKSGSAVGKSLGRAARAVWGALRGR